MMKLLGKLSICFHCLTKEGIYEWCTSMEVEGGWGGWNDINFVTLMFMTILSCPCLFVACDIVGKRLLVILLRLII